MSGGQGRKRWSRGARPRRGGVARVGAVVLCGAAVAGCGGTDYGHGAGAPLPAGGTTTTSLSPVVTRPPALQAKVVQAVALTQAEKRARTSISVTFTGNGSDSLAGGTFDVAGSGVVDLVSGDADLTLSIPLFDRLGGGGTIEQRIVARVVYTRLPGPLLRMAELPTAVRWLSLDPRTSAAEPSALSQSQVDPAAQLAFLGAVSDDVRTGGRVAVRGVPTTHYIVRTDRAELSSANPANAAAATKLRQLGSVLDVRPVVVEVWLDDRGRARRIVTSFPLTAPGDPATTRTDAMMRVQSDYYAFGVPVHAVAPVPREVRPYSALDMHARAGGIAVG